MEEISPLLLIVHKDENTRRATSSAARAAGFSVTEAASWTEALSRIELGPDLIILDGRIPDIAEYEAWQRLNAYAGTGSIPVLRMRSDVSKENGGITLLEEGRENSRSEPIEPIALLSEIGSMFRIQYSNRDKRSVTRWNAVFDAVGDAICVLDAEGRIRRFNSAFRDFAGFGDEDMIGLEYREVIHGKAVSGEIFLLPTVLRSGVRENSELKTGDRFCLISTDPVFDEDNSIIGFVCIIKDVTELKNAQKTLESDYEMLSLAGEIARFGGWSVDLSTNIVAWSDAVADIHEMPKGYAPSVSEGIDFYHPDWQPRITELFSLCAREGVPYDAEMEIVTGAGKRVWVRTVGAAIRDEDGHIVKVHGAFQDISSRKKAEESLKNAMQRLERVTQSIIQVLIKAIESRDPYTAGHQERVSDLAARIASEMGLSEFDCHGIRIASTIHDIGKIAVSAEILSKSRSLSTLEFELVKEHARHGFEILKDVEFDWPVAEMIHQHHERLDGSGYPRGISGDGICLGARILAVADVVEAMASHRPYRPSRRLDEALEEVRSKRGILYDPDAVDACLRLFAEKGYSLLET